jgi:hypothetical protein
LKNAMLVLAGLILGAGAVGVARAADAKGAAPAAACQWEVVQQCPQDKFGTPAPVLAGWEPFAAPSPGVCLWLRRCIK